MLHLCWEENNPDMAAPIKQNIDNIHPKNERDYEDMARVIIPFQQLVVSASTRKRAKSIKRFMHCIKHITRLYV